MFRDVMLLSLGRETKRETESSRIYRYGELEEQGVDQRACCPDANAHENLISGRHVFVNLPEGVRDEPWYHESHPFLDVDPDDHEDTRHIQRCEIFPRLRNQEEE